MAQNNGLPKTIEGATSRYLHHYETHFNMGPRKGMVRLKNQAEASIFDIRRKAPNFYENDLPKLVNQAASALLACDTSSANGSRKFHETHRNFLKVLNELKKFQPLGPVHFQNEVQRLREKEKRLRTQPQLRHKIIENEEFAYSRLFSDEFDMTRDELEKILKMIAKLEGEEIDFGANIELVIPEGSSLERLSASQKENLKDLTVDYLKQKKNKKKSMCVDKSSIRGPLMTILIFFLAFLCCWFVLYPAKTRIMVT